MRWRRATGLVDAFLVVVRAAFASRSQLAVENLALRQQLAVLRRSVERPRLHRRDRFFWAWLSRIWSDVAIRPHHRQARDGHPLASPWVPSLLALEVTVHGRPTASRCRDPFANQANE